MISFSEQSVVSSFYDWINHHLSHADDLMIVCIIYALICMAILFLSKVILNKSIKEAQWIFYLLPLLLAIFVPVLGIFISLFIMISVVRLHTQFYKYTEQLDDSINLTEMKYASEQYGSGGAFLRLMKKNEAPVERTKALFVLAQGQLSRVNNMLQDLLPDTSDEIRLLSFNILDQQEGYIQKDINKILAVVETTNPESVHYAKFEKNLALLYWELSYRHLILKELEDVTLQKALTYARSALKTLQDDAVIWSLLGKIYYRLKEYKRAEDAFQQALCFDIPASQVLPYLAEISFKMKDYMAVKHYLSESDTLLDIALIAPVKRFWDKE